MEGLFQPLHLLILFPLFFLCLLSGLYLCVRIVRKAWKGLRKGQNPPTLLET